jgi:predicted alpha-1,6-mannanase (GH76 family)
VLRSPPARHHRLSPSYWWQAQLLDALIDAQERAPSALTARQIRWLIGGQWLANRGRLRNDYYDDMEWMGLALLRCGRRPAAARLWRTIRAGWNERHGGGIPWRVQQPHYKNTPANGPAAILAARLGDGEWAKRIVDWMESALIDADTGEVLDGIDRNGDGLEDHRRFSYNYGTALAAELAVGRRALAERIATAGIAQCAADGILRAEGAGDGSLFKSIFARYLVELGGPGARSVVLATAESFWANRDSAGRFGLDPRLAPTGPVQLSAMVAGVTLIELAARIERGHPGPGFQPAAGPIASRRP